LAVPLAAAGRNVVGIDIAGKLVERAWSSGIAASYIRAETDPDKLPLAARGCDAVIVTAATEPDDPIRLAARWRACS